MLAELALIVVVTAISGFNATTAIRKSFDGPLPKMKPMELAATMATRMMTAETIINDFCILSHLSGGGKFHSVYHANL